MIFILQKGRSLPMFTIYEYYDIERIKNLILTCQGNVYLPMKDGSEIDLKENLLVLETLFHSGIGKNGLQVRLTDWADVISFIWIAMQAA